MFAFVVVDDDVVVVVDGGGGNGGGGGGGGAGYLAVVVPLRLLMWDTSLPLALQTSSFALAGSIRTEFGRLINMQNLYLSYNQLSGTPPFAHFAWCGSTSLRLTLKTSSSALAGSIPTEFGKLVNTKELSFGDNQLTGTPSLLIYLVW